MKRLTKIATKLLNMMQCYYRITQKKEPYIYTHKMHMYVGVKYGLSKHVNNTYVHTYE